MKYLLDTCVISEMIKKHPNKNIVTWIKNSDEDAIFLSVLTIGEIQKDISRLNDKQRCLQIQRWLDVDLKERFTQKILPISVEVALTWGEIEAKALAIGKPIPSIDGLIAATALTHNLTLVTRNVKDIKETGVKFLDLWSL
ncbi:MAG: type II toxin-antitoxin system VapC family toxin [Deltaproteobacteria bacterium]|nr:type II toxin-antitoxin system VapC family toxin [Deltaproteobacteria bacterium]